MVKPYLQQQRMCSKCTLYSEMQSQNPHLETLHSWCQFYSTKRNMAWESISLTKCWQII